MATHAVRNFLVGAKQGSAHAFPAFNTVLNMAGVADSEFFCILNSHGGTFAVGAIEK